jgi:hypothetical protein
MPRPLDLLAGAVGLAGVVAFVFFALFQIAGA